ncbi:MAG: glycosyltransferase [Candidatus Kaelpia imicola]|nr:glycosyltransferase [Candidatus Kaelpia imicola]
MTVSIIIAVKAWQKNLEECVHNCLSLNYPDFEIIVVPDQVFEHENPNLHIIPSSNVSPAEKRDLGAKAAEGEILAFIDDDVYPSLNWLINAVKGFKDPNIAAVGGPAVTPDSDSLRQKASGKVYGSYLVSGPYTYRYRKERKRFVDDYPSCNLLIRKEVFEALGGFDTKYWPGEDTKLCLDIVHKLNRKIIYDPEVLAYHHRRELFIPHLKQVKSYALHRGYFAKVLPETSRKLAYFVPSLFVLGLTAGGLLSQFSAVIRSIYLGVLFLYLILVSFSSKGENFFLVIRGIVLTHLVYGVFFIKGLISSKLKEE